MSVRRGDYTMADLIVCRNCSLTRGACNNARAGGALACCPECDHRSVSETPGEPQA